MIFSNCIIEAIRAWRDDDKRGHFNVRLSRCGRLIHCSYTRFDGQIVNFTPPGDSKRKPFPPPLFSGQIINHDEAWRCHIQLREWGMSEKELRKMSDNEVISMYEQVISERDAMKGDY